MVKAQFWTDPELLRWPRDKRETYRGLWALAEDSGCLEDDPFGWKLILWPSPVDGDITVDVLTQWRDELIEARKLIPYDADGKPYLYLRTFHNHESPRNPQRPDLPLPAWVEWVPDSDSKERSRGHYQVDRETVGSRYCDSNVAPAPSSTVPISLEGKHSSKPSKRSTMDDSDFEEFYAAYPRKEGRGQAVKAFRTARKKAPPETILSGLKKQLPGMRERDRQFIPLPATWLNGERWLDDEGPPEQETPAERYERLCGIVGEQSAKAAVYGS